MASLVMDAILPLETGGLTSQILLSYKQKEGNFKRLQIELSVTSFSNCFTASMIHARKTAHAKLYHSVWKHDSACMGVTWNAL